ncbi:MAG: spore coat U domain-containing protein [Pseudomonadota bacterium]
MSRHALFATLAVALVGGATPAKVQAAASCAVAATSVSFGTYNPFTVTNNDSTGEIRITCSGPLLQLIAYSVSISAGNGTYAARRMTNGINSLEYNLYIDPLYLNVWGDSAFNSLLLSISYVLTLSPTTRQHTVYGRLRAGQTNAVPGVYTDNVAVTVSF